jgi:hypothetical protein
MENLLESVAWVHNFRKVSIGRKVDRQSAVQLIDIYPEACE